MGIFKGFIAACKALSWLNKQRKGVEKHGIEYLSDSRMKDWRFGAERIGRALEKGDLSGVPPIIRWFLGRTRVDNQAGHAIQVLLKSEKLKTGDKCLNPTYPPH